MIEQITQKDKRDKREGAGEVRTAGGGWFHNKAYI